MPSTKNNLWCRFFPAIFITEVISVVLHLRLKKFFVRKERCIGQQATMGNLTLQRDLCSSIVPNLAKNPQTVLNPKIRIFDWFVFSPFLRCPRKFVFKEDAKLTLLIFWLFWFSISIEKYFGQTVYPLIQKLKTK